MPDPIFSIVIPTYNHAHLLNRCIDSLIAQTDQDWEAIVVNNFSEDNTIEIIEKYADNRIRLVNFRNNGIIAASRNEGIRNARGGFVAFLDSDDWWQATKLAAVREQIAFYDVIYHNLEIVYSSKKPFFKQYLRPRHLKAPVYRDLLVNGNCIPNSGVTVKRELLLKAEGLDENKEIVALEDYDLWVRISKFTDRFLYLPQVLGYYWIGGNNMTQATDKQIKRYEAFYDKHLPDLKGKEVKAIHSIKSYNIGRIKEKMGLFKEATRLYGHALHAENYIIKLKSGLLMINSLFKSIFKKAS